MKTVPLRRLAACLDGRRIPLSAEQRAEFVGDVPYWGANGVVDYVRDALFDELLVLVGEDGAPFFDPTKDVAFTVNGPIWPNNHIHVLRPMNVDARFLTYALNVVDYGPVISGSTRDKLTQGDMAAMRISEHQYVEQRRIADFLDDRVARINRIIAARREQVVLAMRAQSVALTEATAPPGDTTGWMHLKFSRVAVLNDGLVDPTLENFASMPLVAPNHIEKGTGRLLSLESAEAQGATSGKGLARKGQIIYSKIRPNLRKAVAAPHDCLISADAYAIEPRDGVLSRAYLLATLLGDYFTQQVIDASERVAMPKVNRDSLAEVFIWVPTPEEQERRVAVLQRQTRDLRRGVALLTDSVAVLTEYKTSLITAAVTGKLDVSTAGSGIPG